MTLIGICGRARAGKDTSAEYLCRKYGLQQAAFAAPLKAMLRAAFDADFDGGDREAPIPWLGKSPRQLMQLLGTEWGRSLVHPDLWLLLMERRMAKTSSGLVISDVRFDNEAAWLASKGGLLIHILRPGAREVASHASEAGLSSRWPRRFVQNDRDLEHLYWQLDEAVASHV